MTLGRGAKTILLLAAVVIVCAGLKLAAPVIVPLLLSVFLTLVTTPVALFMTRKKVPAVVAVVVVLLVVLLIVAFFGALLGGSISSFYERIPVYTESFRALLAQTTETLGRFGIHLADGDLGEAVDPSYMLGLVGSLLRGVAGVLSNTLLVLAIVAFMLFEAIGLRERLADLSIDREIVERVRRSAKQVNRYLFVKTVTSCVTGALVAAFCGATSVDLPLLWGLLAFLLNFVPTVGAILASAPPILLALMQQGTGGGLVVLTGMLVINLGVAAAEPRFLGRALGLTPLAVFLSMVFWGWLLGPVGALLSVPLTMVIKLYCANTADMRWVVAILAPRAVVEAVRQEFPETERVSLPPGDPLESAS